MPLLDQERFFSMGEVYDRMCRRLVPQYDWLHEALIDMLHQRLPPASMVVDIGAGSGILLERILTTFPGMRACCMDYSEDFLEVARRRLQRFGDRVRFLHAAFNDPWDEQLPETPAAIVSMSAIHHLTDDHKRRLYARCLRALVPGGWFFNIDEMRARRDDAYLRTLEQWSSYVAHAGEHLTDAEERQGYQRWLEPFDNWRRRNITCFGAPKQEGDDLHAPYDLQLTMLDELGYEEVDLFVKYHLFCLIGGRRPETRHIPPDPTRRAAASQPSTGDCA